MATDPVCKMSVDEEAAAAKAAYNSRTFYFCSEACKKKSESEPKKFAQ